MYHHKSARLGIAAALITLASVTLGSTSAYAQFLGPTQLKLMNGWTNTQYSTTVATVEEVSGIVQFRGAISTTGTNVEPFVLIPELRPAATVYVPVDMCGATKGRLIIETSGVVTVEAQNSFSDAACFTSLDGASFARTAADFRSLTLINGWTNSPYGTSAPAAIEIAGVVHFKGAISTSGTNAEPFVLPTYYRPAVDVYIPIDLCSANNGRLWIQPNGVVTVQAETDFSEAQCFTSLDGAFFVRNGVDFQALTLENDWTGEPYGTAAPQAGSAYGIVYFQGGMSTGGTDANPFVLPPELTPVTNVYIPVDLCNATNGRLLIQTNGTVTVQAETDFSNAQCFTSLDGVSFVQ